MSGQLLNHMDEMWHHVQVREARERNLRQRDNRLLSNARNEDELVQASNDNDGKGFLLVFQRVAGRCPYRSFWAHQTDLYKYKKEHYETKEAAYKRRDEISTRDTLGTWMGSDSDVIKFLQAQTVFPYVRNLYVVTMQVNIPGHVKMSK